MRLLQGLARLEFKDLHVEFYPAEAKPCGCVAVGATQTEPPVDEPQQSQTSSEGQAPEEGQTQAPVLPPLTPKQVEELKLLKEDDELALALIEDPVEYERRRLKSLEPGE